MAPPPTLDGVRQGHSDENDPRKKLPFIIQSGGTPDKPGFTRRHTQKFFWSLRRGLQWVVPGAFPLASAMTLLLDSRQQHARAASDRATNVECHSNWFISTEVNLALLDYGAGKKLEAKQKLEQLLGEARARQYVDKQASILDWLGWIQAQEGDAAGARVYWQEAKQLYLQLKMNDETQRVQGRTDGLAPAAQTK